VDWRAKVELFENIRRQYEFGGRSIRDLAREFGVHRRMVREAIRDAIPQGRKKPDRPNWKLKPYISLIEAMLEADRHAPRKQRHTAHRIWRRIKSEVPGFDISERTIRKYVRKRRLAPGFIGRETCIPQSYP
jgi:transposase